MDPMKNPYAPGAGARPPQLAGRDDELESFGVVVQRIGRRLPERSVVVAGLRGVGKTVLLLEFQSLAEQHQWATAKIEARPGVGLRGTLGRAAHQVLRTLSRRHRTNDKIKAVFRTLKSFAISTSTTGEVTLRLDVDPEPGRADSGDAETDLTELLVDIGEAAATEQTGVAFFVDEMQDLDPADLVALVGAFHEIGQRQLPVLVVGAGLPHLPSLLSTAKTYAERLFSYRLVGPLSTQAATEALVVPARRLDVEFTPDAIDQVLHLSGGYPYFLQAYGKQVWDVAAGSPIDIVDVETAATEARRQLDIGFFGSRYERATPRERDYLRAMADLGDGPHRTADVATAMGRKQTDVSLLRDALIKKGLVYSAERGQIDFTVPQFGEFLSTRE